MQKHWLLIGGTLLVLLAVVSAGLFAYVQPPRDHPPSPYVDQLSSPVRGLSAQEVEDLLNGGGAGYARMAELNSYPGPRHVLALKAQLQLSGEQTQQIEAVFQQMEAEAKRLGRAIVERERRLSTTFARRTVTPRELHAQTAALATLYGHLRATHLRAHVDITPLLSPEQIARYNRLRGYSDSDVPTDHQHQHQHE